MPSKKGVEGGSATQRACAGRAALEPASMQRWAGASGRRGRCGRSGARCARSRIPVGGNSLHLPFGDGASRALHSRFKRTLFSRLTYSHTRSYGFLSAAVKRIATPIHQQTLASRSINDQRREPSRASPRAPPVTRPCPCRRRAGMPRERGARSQARPPPACPSWSRRSAPERETGAQRPRPGAQTQSAISDRCRGTFLSLPPSPSPSTAGRRTAPGSRRS